SAICFCVRDGLGIGSVIEQSHERVPEDEHQQEERNRRVHEQPRVQPVLQFNLEIEHAALVAPALYFFHAISIRFANAQLDETKCVFGEARIAKSHPIAAARGKIRNDLAIEKIEERGFGIVIRRGDRFWRRWGSGRFCDWLRWSCGWRVLPRQWRRSRDRGWRHD